MQKLLSLRYIRRIVATVFVLLFAFAFIDFSNIFSPDFLKGLLYLQFTPSVLKFIKVGGIVTTGFIVVIFLTLLFGRVYCSTLCPLGILQDIHWSGGAFGYFPTYALGSAYSAQWMSAMRKDIDVERCLENNDFKSVNDWLKNNVHRHGGVYVPSELLLSVTGESFNPQYYVDYLKEKYSKLFEVNE